MFAALKARTKRDREQQQIPAAVAKAQVSSPQAIDQVAQPAHDVHDAVR
jgi:hypothetical protein